MTELRVQKLHLSNCEDRIEQSYYEWGRGDGKDDRCGIAWESASPVARQAIAQRGFLLYDGWPALGGVDIGPLEAYVSVGINSRVILNDVVRFLAMAEEARPLLARIPDEAVLEDATEDQIAAAVDLLELIDRMPHIGLGKATKVLYKKRPGFIPVIDSVVSDFLIRNFPHRLSSWPSSREQLELFREIVLARLEPLTEIQGTLAVRGFPLSRARILSHAVWMEWQALPSESRFGTHITAIWGAKDAAGARALAQAAWTQQV